MNRGVIIILVKISYRNKNIRPSWFEVLTSNLAYFTGNHNLTHEAFRLIHLKLF